MSEHAYSSGAAHGILSRFVRVGAAELSGLVRGRGLNPAMGAAAVVPGKQFAELMSARSLEGFESTLTWLIAEAKSGLASRQFAIDAATEMVKNASNEEDLVRLYGAFFHQREVLLSIAKSPNIPERLQMLLVQQHGRDRELMCALAGNKVAAERPIQTLLRASTDAYVIQGVAREMSKAGRSAEMSARTVWASRLCEELAFNQDAHISSAAIAGVRNPDLLRQIESQTSALLAPHVMDAVAKNPHTPPDVLNKISQSALPAIGILPGSVDPKLSARQELDRRLKDRQVEFGWTA